MRKISAFIIVLAALQCICTNVCAQGKTEKENNGFVRNIVHRIFYPQVRYDTLYIGRPWGKWTVSLNENLMQHHYNLVIDGESDPIRSKLNTTTGIGVAYRGVGAVISVNFRKISGKTNDRDFGLRLLNSCFGGEIRLFSVGDFYDTRFKTEVSYKNNLKGLTINAYYVFNNKKFSYPAAFSFSQIQKTSAGSMTAVMSFYSDNLWLGYDNDIYQEVLDHYYEDWGYHEVQRDSITEVLSGWTTKYLSAGIGYAYNWVPEHSWLIHFSIEPALMIWNKRAMSLSDVFYSRKTNAEDFDIEIKDNDYNVPYFPLNFCCNGKASISYSWKRGYVAAYYTTTMSYINLRGMDKIMGGKSKSVYRYWTARFSIGYRF